MRAHSREFVFTVFWFFCFAMGYMLHFGKTTNKKHIISSIVLTRIRLPGVVWTDSPRVGFRCGLSRVFRVQFPCAVTCFNVCARVKVTNAGSRISLFGDTEILHTLTGMGSAALSVAVALPIKATRISKAKHSIDGVF